MSCDTNKTTVDLGDWRPRHRREDDGRDFDSLRDLLAAGRESEAHRDIVEKVLEVGQANLKETLEAKFANIKETIQAKAEVLKAIAETAAEVKEAKHDLVVKVLESQLANEKGLREILCRPRERGGCNHHND